MVYTGANIVDAIYQLLGKNLFKVFVVISACN